MIKGTVAFTYGLILVMTVFAATPAVSATEPRIYEEEEVVITATRTSQSASETPGSTEIITKEEIEASGAVNVAEVLGQKGLVISANGGASAVSTLQLDGFSSSQTLILVNGTPASTGSTGTVDLSYFPVAGIQKIEVVHGPLSALYGSNALGGVVNIITDLTGESLNTLQWSAGTYHLGNATYFTRNQKYGMAISGLTTEGHRERSAARNFSILAQYDFYQNENSYLTLDLLHMEKDSQNPGSLSSHPEIDEFAETSGFNLRGRHAGAVNWEYKFFGQSLDYKYEAQFQPARHQTQNFGVDLAGTYLTGKHIFLAGTMLRQDHYDSTATGHHHQNIGAVFLQDEWEINETWLLTSGLRWDTGSDYSSPLTPRFSIIHQLSERAVVKFGYGKAFRAPTVNDLYWPADMWSAGNPDLQPELSERYEISGEWKYGTTAYHLNLFRADIRDGIVWVTENSISKPVNFDKMQVDGVIASWQTGWSEHFSTGLRYSWIDKRGFEDATQSYTKNLNFFGSNQWTLNALIKYPRWFLQLDWHLAGKRSKQDDWSGFPVVIPVDMPNYQLLNLNLTYQIQPGLSCRLTLNNVTDEDYQIHYEYPMPGREIQLGIAYQF